jgi:predicted transcriptional regulator
MRGGNMDVNKKRDLNFIKEFKKITVSGICKELKIDRSTVYRGIASAENIKKVKEEIKKRLKELEDI